mgnify:FL=1
MNKIIAVVGMCGSGKSIVSEYLESIGLKKVYFGGVTMEKLKESGEEVNEKNERKMREGLRRDYGMGAYAILTLPKIEEYLKSSNVVIDGLYSWDELKILKEKFEDNFFVISVVVDKSIRYNRLTKRDIRRLTNKEAKSRDISEIEALAKGGPIAYADYFILNNGSMDDYMGDIKKITNEILK